MKNTLFLIPARGGSKGIPGKNIKLLGGKPLIHYSIDIARKMTGDEMICVSTDDEQIREVVQAHKLKVPFLRPPELATDQAGSYEVILHALDQYEKRNIKVERVILLQPTSPFRTAEQVKAAGELFNADMDMVISVKAAKSNPFHLMYTENKKGYLEKIGNDNYDRRQDVPPVYEINGAIYVMNADSLRKQKISEFTRIRKYVMPDLNSLDIDYPEDWLWAEFLIEKGLIKPEV